jgi:ribonuclease-3
MDSRPPDLDRLQQKIGYRFHNLALLEEALRHPSIASTGSTETSNQRLEFLGDAVLQLVVSDELFRHAPEAREGALSQRRSALTKGLSLAILARELGLAAELVLSPAEEQSGGRHRSSALEDAFEALIAAVYLDGGLAAARENLLRWYGPLPERLAALEGGDNPKGRLQELVQPKHGNDALRYEVTKIKGQPHERRFDVNLFFLDRLLGTGTGSSKKEAEESAAREALAQWTKSAPN